MKQENIKNRAELDTIVQQNCEEVEKAMKIIEHSGVFGIEKIEESKQMLTQYKKAMHDFVYETHKTPEEREQIEKNLYSTLKWMLALDAQYDALEKKMNETAKSKNTFH